jgi:hypothetical protein
LFLDRAGQPTYHDVATICGDSIAAEWLETPACPSPEGGPPGPPCTGVYIHFVRQMERVDHEIVKLDITIDATIEGEQIVIDASDPLPDERIVRIEALINETPIVCDDKREIPCIIPLYPTPAEGKTLTVCFSIHFFGSRGESRRLCHPLGFPVLFQYPLFRIEG